MKYAPMRFSGLSLRCNPEKLIISSQNHIREYISPCCGADSRNLGTELRRISGEGELFGADCIEQYRALERLCKSVKCAKLVISGMQPLYAYLKELSATAEAVDEVLAYRFVFVEAQSPRQSAVGTVYHVTREDDESLWDIAQLYSVPIEQLVRLNPHIPDIDGLKENERVRVC